MKHYSLIFILSTISIIFCYTTNSKYISFYTFSNSPSNEFLQVLSNKYNKRLKSFYSDSSVTIKYSNYTITNCNIYQTYYSQSKNTLTIDKDFVLSTKNLNNDLYYQDVYQNIKSKKHQLAIKILTEVNKNKNSKFFYFFRNLFNISINLPVLFQWSTLNAFSTYNLINSTISSLSQYKKEYNDLRRLIFILDNKKEFIGSFLYGDYIWAINVVNSFGIEYKNDIYLIPGTETINYIGVNDKRDSFVFIEKEDKNKITLSISSKELNIIEKFDKIFFGLGGVVDEEFFPIENCNDVKGELFNLDEVKQEILDINLLFENSYEIDNENEIGIISKYLMQKVELLTIIQDCIIENNKIKTEL